MVSTHGDLHGRVTRTRYLVVLVFRQVFEKKRQDYKRCSGTSTHEDFYNLHIILFVKKRLISERQGRNHTKGENELFRKVFKYTKMLYLNGLYFYDLLT